MMSSDTVALVTVTLFVITLISFYFIARYTYDLIKRFYSCSLLTKAQAREVGRIIADELDPPRKRERNFSRVS